MGFPFQNSADVAFILLQQQLNAKTAAGTNIVSPTGPILDVPFEIWVDLATGSDDAKDPLRGTWDRPWKSITAGVKNQIPVPANKAQFEQTKEIRFRGPADYSVVEAYISIPTARVRIMGDDVVLPGIVFSPINAQRYGSALDAEVAFIATSAMDPINTDDHPLMIADTTPGGHSFHLVTTAAFAGVSVTAHGASFVGDALVDALCTGHLQSQGATYGGTGLSAVGMTVLSQGDYFAGVCSVKKMYRADHTTFEGAVTCVQGNTIKGLEGFTNCYFPTTPHALTGPGGGKIILDAVTAARIAASSWTVVGWTEDILDAIALSVFQNNHVRALVCSTVNSAIAGFLTIDGVTVQAGDRVLLVGQTAPVENGLWLAAAGVWTRPTDFPVGGQAEGAVFWTIRGTANGGKVFGCTTPAPADVIGGDPLTFVLTYQESRVQRDMLRAVCLVAAGVGALATNATFAKPNTPGQAIWGDVDGVGINIGDGTKVAVQAYVSADAGATAKAWNNIAVGDQVYWNNNVGNGNSAPYSLAITNRISIYYGSNQ